MKTDYPKNYTKDSFEVPTYYTGIYWMKRDKFQENECHESRFILIFTFPS